MCAKKIDLKKEFPKFYRPSSKKVEIIDIPVMKYFMIDGSGDPNDNPRFEIATQCLYAASYLLKMKIVKNENPEMDYVVPPLEGLWYLDDMTKFTHDRKDLWEWTLMIRIPDFVTEEQINRALKNVDKSKPELPISELRYEVFEEKSVVQIMHIGPYADEAPTIAKLHEFAFANAYELSGKHHEIYLSDPRKAKPETMKTILRQPIIKQ